MLDDFSGTISSCRFAHNSGISDDLENRLLELIANKKERINYCSLYTYYIKKNRYSIEFKKLVAYMLR